MKKRIRFFHKLKDRLFAGAYLAILILGIAITFISCKDNPSDTKVSDTEIWRLELEQIDDGTPATYPRRGTVNMLLRLNRTRQPDPTCEDAENPDVTTFLADVEALSSRLQQATTGSADGSWNCHGFRATVQLKDGTRYELVSDISLDGFDCLSPDEDCPAGRVQKIDNETSMLPYRWTAGARRGHFFLARNENFAWDPIYDTFVDVLVQNERNESAEFYVNAFGYSPGGAHNGLAAESGPGLVEVEANSSIHVSWMAHSARQGRGLSYPNHPQDPEARTIIILWNHADPPFERRAALTCFLAPDHPRTVQFLIHEDGTLECGTGWLGSILLSVSRRLLYIERGFHQVSDTLTIITGNVDSLRVESSHPNVRPVLPDYTPPVPSRRELLVVAVDHEAPLAEQYVTIRVRNDDTGEFNWISVPVFVYKLNIEANPNRVAIPIDQTGIVEVNVTERRGVFSDVLLSMPDPPPGIVPSFNPVLANNTSTLTLDLGTTVQPEAGTYHLPICATIKDDPGKTCHAATYITLIIPEPPPATYELSIAMTGSNDGNIQLGDSVFFDLSVQHDGLDGAAGVEVTDLLPEGLAFDVIESINKGTYTAETGLWGIGSLPPNTTAALRISAIAAREGTWTNTATITAGLAAGDDPGNNEASVDITVGNDRGAAACAEFDLRLDFSPIEVAAGGSDAVAVFVDRTTGFTGQVELTLFSVNGGPRWSDVMDTWAFSPNAVPGNTAVSTFSFTMRGDVTQGDYPFGIAGGSPLLETDSDPCTIPVTFRVDK